MDPLPDDSTPVCATDYVTQAAWLRPAGRPDAVDEVADQFERRRDPEPAPVAWPRRSRGWRARTGWHPHPQEQRAAG